MAQTGVCFGNPPLGANAGCFYSPACFISINTVERDAEIRLVGYYLHIANGFNVCVRAFV